MPCTRAVGVAKQWHCMKVGFLGGSFDPIHFGHLLAAQDAFEQMGLDRVLFVPLSTPPLKDRKLVTSDEDRLAMIRAAIEWDRRFDVRDDEIRRGGVSFTIDSMRAFRVEFPDDRLFWIIGSDQAAQLEKWREIGELVRIVEFICLERPGHPVRPGAEIPGLRIHPVASHRIDVSSTEIRERARRGLSLHYFVPLAVNCHITERLLYRGPGRNCI